MRLTVFTDYCLRTLIYVAANRSRRTTIAEIADSYGVSQNHLVKCVHFLARMGWLRSIRGRGGGLELALAPRNINVGQVVRQTEGGDVPAECFQSHGNRCLITRNCRLRRIFDEAVEALYAVLERYTLDDLVQNQAALARVLFHNRK